MLSVELPFILPILALELLMSPDLPLSICVLRVDEIGTIRAARALKNSVKKRSLHAVHEVVI